MTLSTVKHKKRLLVFFVCCSLMGLALILRIGYIQVVEGEKLSKLAVEQQTRDVPVPAKRGVIYDRNKKELAVSSISSTIWANPSSVRSAKGKNQEEIREREQENIQNTAKTLADILEMDEEQVRSLITKKQSIVRVAKYVDQEKTDRIREAELKGISIAEDVRRYYPEGPFAAHVLGSTTADNHGLSGVELEYDSYLCGTPGRWIRNTNVNGEGIKGGTEKYLPSQDGLSAVLTVDEVIQHYVEKAVAQQKAATNAKRVMCLVMEPKTGDILAMAMAADYDPNDPRTPLDPNEAAYVKSLPDGEKQNYWNDMWRNPMISDTYEPGSTFKLITTSIALDEGVTKPDDKFVCTGYYSVGDTRLKCWRYYRPHGAETLVQAVQNSCNPVFIQLALRLGKDTYYNRLGQFGFLEKTGIDYPGEGRCILQDKSVVGPVELATMSYGQGISVTPIRLITAVSALGNDGKLMRPRLVKELTDKDGNVITAYKPEVVRQAVSPETAATMRQIMESVVAVGGGGNAKVTGYRIGGKTGTANKPLNGRYAEDKTYGSFIAMAPMDDPKITVLFIVDEPQGVHYGSQTAGPGVKSILEDTLKYLDVKPVYTPEEQKQIDSRMTRVPDVTGDKFSAAAGKLAGASLDFRLSPVPTDPNQDMEILDQYPKGGEQTGAGNTVCLYWK